MLYCPEMVAPLEQGALECDGVLHAVDDELGVAGGHGVGVAAAHHRVGLRVGVDDVDRAVDRELIGIDGVGLAVAGDAEIVAAEVLVEGVEVPAEGKHLRRSHERVGGRRAVHAGGVGEHRRAVYAVHLVAEADDIAVTAIRGGNQAGLQRYCRGGGILRDGHDAVNRVVPVDVA